MSEGTINGKPLHPAIATYLEEYQQGTMPLSEFWHWLQRSVPPVKRRMSLLAWTIRTTSTNWYKRYSEQTEFLDA